MATIKSHTDLGQAKKLAEILPLESADMYYHYTTGVKSYHEDVPNYVQVFNHFVFFHYDIPCWSLAALLNVLPNGTEVVKEKADTENERYMCSVLVNDSLVTTFASNPVDACVDAIIKLNKQL